MIKINLLTTKPSKKIPLGVFIPIIVLGIVGIFTFLVWNYASDFAENYNTELKDEIKEKKAKYDKGKSKYTERDKLKKEKINLARDIQKLQRLSGSNFVQWSETLKTLKYIYPKDKVWITSFRIDSDRRVQIVAFSSASNDSKSRKSQQGQNDGRLSVGIQEFIHNLLQNQYFSEVFLNNATKNIYEKKPVWRFELNCRLRREY